MSNPSEFDEEGVNSARPFPSHPQPISMEIDNIGIVEDCNTRIHSNPQYSNFKATDSNSMLSSCSDRTTSDDSEDNNMYTITNRVEGICLVSNTESSLHPENAGGDQTIVQRELIQNDSISHIPKSRSLDRYSTFSPLAKRGKATGQIYISKSLSLSFDKADTIIRAPREDIFKLSLDSSELFTGALPSDYGEEMVCTNELREADEAEEAARIAANASHADEGEIQSGSEEDLPSPTGRPVDKSKHNQQNAQNTEAAKMYRKDFCDRVLTMYPRLHDYLQDHLFHGRLVSYLKPSYETWSSRTGWENEKRHQLLYLILDINLIHDMEKVLGMVLPNYILKMLKQCHQPLLQWLMAENGRMASLQQDEIVVDHLVEFAQRIEHNDFLREISRPRFVKKNSLASTTFDSADLLLSTTTTMDSWAMSLEDFVGHYLSNRTGSVMQEIAVRNKLALLNVFFADEIQLLLQSIDWKEWLEDEKRDLLFALFINTMLELSRAPDTLRQSCLSAHLDLIQSTIDLHVDEIQRDSTLILALLGLLWNAREFEMIETVINRFLVELPKELRSNPMFLEDLRALYLLISCEFRCTPLSYLTVKKRYGKSITFQEDTLRSEGIAEDPEEDCNDLESGEKTEQTFDMMDLYPTDKTGDEVEKLNVENEDDDKSLHSTEEDIAVENIYATLNSPPVAPTEHQKQQFYPFNSAEEFFQHQQNQLAWTPSVAETAYSERTSRASEWVEVRSGNQRSIYTSSKASVDSYNVGVGMDFAEDASLKGDEEPRVVRSMEPGGLRPQQPQAAVESNVNLNPLKSLNVNQDQNVCKLLRKEFSDKVSETYPTLRDHLRIHMFTGRLGIRLKLMIDKLRHWMNWDSRYLESLSYLILEISLINDVERILGMPIPKYIMEQMRQANLNLLNYIIQDSLRIAQVQEEIMLLDDLMEFGQRIQYPMFLKRLARPMKLENSSPTWRAMRELEEKGVSAAVSGQRKAWIADELVDSYLQQPSTSPQQSSKVMSTFLMRDIALKNKKAVMNLFYLDEMGRLIHDVDWKEWLEEEKKEMMFLLFLLKIMETANVSPSLRRTICQNYLPFVQRTTMIYEEEIRNEGMLILGILECCWNCRDYHLLAKYYQDFCLDMPDFLRDNDKFQRELSRMVDTINVEYQCATLPCIVGYKCAQMLFLPKKQTENATKEVQDYLEVIKAWMWKWIQKSKPLPNKELALYLTSSFKPTVSAVSLSLSIPRSTRFTDTSSLSSSSNHIFTMQHQLSMLSSEMSVSSFGNDDFGEVMSDGKGEEQAGVNDQFFFTQFADKKDETSSKPRLFAAACKSRLLLMFLEHPYDWIDFSNKSVNWKDLNSSSLATKAQVPMKLFCAHQNLMRQLTAYLGAHRIEISQVICHGYGYGSLLAKMSGLYFSNNPKFQSVAGVTVSTLACPKYILKVNRDERLPTKLFCEDFVQEKFEFPKFPKISSTRKSKFVDEVKSTFKEFTKKPSKQVKTSTEFSNISMSKLPKEKFFPFLALDLLPKCDGNNSLHGANLPPKIHDAETFEHLRSPFQFVPTKPINSLK